jgi:hypothetical protein
LPEQTIDIYFQITEEIKTNYFQYFAYYKK